MYNASSVTVDCFFYDIFRLKYNFFFETNIFTPPLFHVNPEFYWLMQMVAYILYACLKRPIHDQYSILTILLTDFIENIKTVLIFIDDNIIDKMKLIVYGPLKSKTRNQTHT